MLTIVSYMLCSPSADVVRLRHDAMAAIACIIYHASIARMSRKARKQARKQTSLFRFNVRAEHAQAISRAAGHGTLFPCCIGFDVW